MSRPPVFPLKPLPRPGRFRRTPPVIFLPILGLLALGLGWRQAATAFDLPGGVVEMVLGAGSLLWLWAVICYGVKALRRPGAVVDDLRVLPGRAGLAALAMSFAAMALVVLPYGFGAARGLTLAGLVLHLGFAALLVGLWRGAPAEARVVSPVWQLSFAGVIHAALPAHRLGWDGLVAVLFWTGLAMAVAIWLASLWQLWRRIPPAVLRPLLVLHVVPAALLGGVALDLGQGGAATGFAVLGGAITLALAVRLRWLIATGYSALWGAFALPLAAWAGLLVSLGGGWQMAGGIALVAATFLVLWVLQRVLRDWAKGTLAGRTNASEA